MNQVNSIAFKVCMYFAANPDEELTSADIVEKFSMATGTKEISSRLNQALAAQWLAVVRHETCGEFGRRRMVFGAGPVLKKLIGATA